MCCGMVSTIVHWNMLEQFPRRSAVLFVPPSHRFLVYVLGSNVSRDAKFHQWPGMYSVSAIGYLVSRLTLPLGREASSILAAFAVSVSGQCRSTPPCTCR